MTLQLSKNPQTAMQEMMNTVDALRDIYKRETDALESMNTQMFLEIQAEKLKAAQEYQAGITQITERKEEMKSIGPLLRKRLEDSHKDFQAVSEKNMQALGRMSRVTEHLGNTIRNAAKDAVVKQRAFSYGETGALNSGGNKTVSMGISETA